MSDLELIRACAEAMGYEALDVGYVGGDDETPRQRELSDWMEGVGLSAVGEYWINVPLNFWIERCDYNPLKDKAQCFALVERFMLCLQPPQFDLQNGWHVWFEPKPNHTAVNHDLRRAIVSCVARLSVRSDAGMK